MTSSSANFVAESLLKIKAVNFRPHEPYTLTSGWKSPVYVDVRKVLGWADVRRSIIARSVGLIQNKVGKELEAISGGETAGIPYAALIAHEMNLPMSYVRKKPKGFGRNALIEGELPEDKRTLLVEDLTTDGGSKVQFVKALREVGATVTDVFVVFNYGVFGGEDDTFRELGVTLHSLCDWEDVLRQSTGYFDLATRDQVREFLNNPIGWSARNGGVSSRAEAALYKAQK
jgi:orotate phosphoribosyltransferase